MGPKWVHMGPKWAQWAAASGMGQNRPNKPKWTQVGPNGSKWVQMDPNGPKWTQMGSGPAIPTVGWGAIACNAGPLTCHRNLGDFGYTLGLFFDFSRPQEVKIIFKNDLEHRSFIFPKYEPVASHGDPIQARFCKI